MVALFILIALSWTGDAVCRLTGLPIPGAILGMALLLLLLGCKVIKQEWIEGGADKLLSFLPLFFIPLFVKILDVTPLLKEFGGRMFLLVVSTTLVVIAVTGLTTKALLSLTKKGKGGASNG